MIDTGLGIKYCGGNANIYNKLLKRFYENYNSHIEELKNLDAEERRRAVHSVKGISLNLGSEDLYKIALAQEYEFQTTDSISSEYENVFLGVVENIKNLIENML